MVGFAAEIRLCVNGAPSARRAAGDGLFSLMLGSINTGLTTVVQRNTTLYLGHRGADSERLTALLPSPASALRRDAGSVSSWPHWCDPTDSPP